MADEQPTRLRDYGLQSERLLWPTKGPSRFEEELGLEEMERALGLTTLEKAVRWAQTKSMWPDTFGLACCAIAMGVCASSGGMFNNYTILQGVDRIVPVDIYVPFCPPRPEALMEGIIR